MGQTKVYIVSKEGKALMPTSRFGRVRHLLKKGKARVVRRNPFTIMLLYETSEYVQPLVMGIDPGSKEISVAVRKEDGSPVFVAELETRTAEVSKEMSKRRMNRRNRRRNRRLKRKRRAKKAGTVFSEKEFPVREEKKPLVCKDIKPKLVRFAHRKREEGWLTPTARHLLQTHINWVKKIAGFLPISKVVVEYGQFDLHKLKNPEIKGKEYQQGRLKGYENAAAYVLQRDGHRCQLCQKDKGVLQVHHVIWRKNGGGDTPENLLTLCEKCHDKVHKNPKMDQKVRKLFKSHTKRYVHATLLGSVMTRFCTWLEENFAEVEKTYGYLTKAKRRELDWPKEHYLDAYLASWTQTPPSSLPEMKVYKFQQFRRHNRQLIHARRDRNYKWGKKIVAKNRKKRTGQTADSLVELVEKNGPKCVSQLKVTKGTKVIRTKFKQFGPGDTVCRNGTKAVAKGFAHRGYSVTLLGENKYVPARECRLLTKNTGIVCLTSIVCSGAEQKDC